MLPSVIIILHDRIFEYFFIYFKMIIRAIIQISIHIIAEIYWMGLNVAVIRTDIKDKIL